MVSNSQRAPLLMLALVLTAGLCAGLSIDKEPVRVTHGNSGPRYEVDEFADKSKLTPVVNEASGASEGPAAGNTDEARPAGGERENDSPPSDQTIPMGHVSIRRIFLVPVMRPARDDRQEGSADGDAATRSERRDEEPADERPAMFAKPFWPFLTPMRPARPHLFGADEASRSPSASAGPEAGNKRDWPFGRPQPSASDNHELVASAGRARNPDQAVFDPIQMILEMMQQAINGQLVPPTRPTDLNKEASSEGAVGDERPKDDKLDWRNETREDLVEIEGKKYLQKVVITRHLHGDNMIFMTKRIIFVPLNETEVALPTTTTTTEPATNEPSSTLTGAREEPTSTTTTTTQAPTTSERAAESTTSATEAKETLGSRISETIEKVERLLEPASSSTTTTSTTTTERPGNQ